MIGRMSICIDFPKETHMKELVSHITDIMCPSTAVMVHMHMAM